MLTINMVGRRITDMETLGETKPLLDEQFAVLADAERRRLLGALLKENPRSDILKKTDESDDDETVRRRVAVRHNHLPRLEDHGLVEWDQQNEIVAKGPEFEQIEPFLLVLDEHRDELPGDLS